MLLAVFAKSKYLQSGYLPADKESHMMEEVNLRQCTKINIIPNVLIYFLILDSDVITRSIGTSVQNHEMKRLGKHIVFCPE